VEGPARGPLRESEVGELALRRSLGIVEIGEQNQTVRESPEHQRVDDSEDETEDADC
jgi:hypothetical protein